MDGDLVVTSAQFLLDSESSINSDFIRIGGSLDSVNSMQESMMSAMHEPVWVEASVDEIMLEESMVRLSHGDIEAWGMPGMTMNFLVADSVDFALFEVGKTMQVQMNKSDSGMFEVVGVKP
jgi:Cu(I)/Ag(I) efflux system membrane fusion protein